ncbi:MAG: hypothetical protein Tsb005_08080 [Gammaproteobacteria bacterium]
MHEAWLADIYPMAGKYRTVTMSKAGFLFAAPNLIPTLMDKFEQNYLKKFTPCNFEELDLLVEALAIVHVEFILIHPFREGNGRLGRLFASLMANQANRPPLNFEAIDQNINPTGFKRYVEAIHEGHNCNYKPMEMLFTQIIQDSEKLA